jgi:hypothetical protein
MAILQSGWRAILGVVALAAIAAVVLLDVLSPDFEILYSGSLVTSDCREIQEKKACVGVYQFTIANSGDKRQDEVRATWGLLLDKWTVKVKVSELTAGTKRNRDPVIVATPEPGRTVYSIGGLDPHLAVELTLTCTACSTEEIQALKNAPLKVTGNGTIENTEPRWTLSGRAVRNLERVVRLLL